MAQETREQRPQTLIDPERFLRKPINQSTITPRFIAEAAKSIARKLDYDLDQDALEKKIHPINKPYDIPWFIQSHDATWFLLTEPDAQSKIFFDVFQPTAKIDEHYHEGFTEALLFLTPTAVLLGDRAYDEPTGSLTVRGYAPGTVLTIPQKFPHRVMPTSRIPSVLLAFSFPPMDDKDFHPIKKEPEGWSKHWKVDPEIIRIS